VRALPFVAGAGLLAASSFALLQLRAPAATAAPVATAPRAADPAPAPPAAPPSTVNVREQIKRAVEVAAPTLRTQPDVQRYLAGLEARARANRQITALEVEPAIAAIHSLDLDPQRAAEMVGEFSQRMNRLAGELAASR
jgi:hypothetical protein